MTNIFDEAAYLQRRAANEAKLMDAGYGPQMEHDACGAGLQRSTASQAGPLLTCD